MRAGSTISQGSSGDDVRRLQRALVRAGFDPGAVDGVFGPQTAAAVRAFQGARGLAVDGVVGPNTWQALPARACVTTFNVPIGRSGCVTVAAGALRQAGEQFRMEVDFDDAGEDCECACGEYRQFVRGTFVANGHPVNHLLPNPAGGAPTPMLPRPAPGAAGDNFLEDGSVAGGNPHYGHRDEDPPGNADPTDQYLAARAAGCQYRGNDFPGLTGPAGTTFSIDLDFVGEAVDVCNGSNVLDSNQWTVTCAGTL